MNVEPYEVDDRHELGCVRRYGAKSEIGVSHEDCPCHTPLRSRESLEAELALMKSIVPMTDSQRNAFIAAVIIIGEKLNEA